MLNLAIIASHPNLATGYANIASSLSNEMCKYYNVFYLGFQNYNKDSIDRHIDDRIQVVDLYALDKESLLGFGDKAILPTLESNKIDIVIVYNDHGVCSSVLKIIESYKCKKVCYIDLVYEYQYLSNMEYIRDNADLLVAFTDSWKNHLEDFYEIPSSKLVKMYHGINTIENTEFTRKDLHFKEDDFIFLSLNRNDSRKNLDLVIESFLHFYRILKKKSGVYLFINCNLQAGINIFEFVKVQCKILNLNINEVQNHIRTPVASSRVTDNYIHSLYKMCDAGISITSGEGFGLTVIEHLNYDKPVICSRLKVFEELIGTDYPYYIDPITYGYSYEQLGGVKAYFKREDVVGMMLKIYLERPDINYSEEFREKFNWETIGEQFKTDLESIF